MKRLDRIEQVARRYVDAGALPGIEWNILRAGGSFARGRYGQGDPLNGVDMADKPIYRIYSMTKPVVAAIIMMALERGRLNLFDPLAAYLPEFAKMQVLADDGSLVRAAPITIEHLLTHRAGLSYGFLADCPVAALYRDTQMHRGDMDFAEIVDLVATLPLAFQPGSKWQYSVATDVLGRVLEVIEGRRLGDIIADYISTPLGLTDTGFQVPPHAQARIAPVFGKSSINDVKEFATPPQKLIAADMSVEHPHDNPDFRRGGMGLFSTLDDYTLIARFLASGCAADGTRLLSRKSVEMLWTDRIPESQKPLAIGPFVFGGYGFGLGGRVMSNPGAALLPTSMGEHGWAGAASTFFWIDPLEDLIGVVMTQYLGSIIPIGEAFMTATYQALDP